MKKIVNVSLVMLLSVLLITGCGKKSVNNNEKNENKENPIITENTKVIGSQTIGTLTFEIKSLKYENEVSILEYSIINESQEEIIIPSFKMTVTNGKNKLYVLNMNYGDIKLNPNESISDKKEIKIDLIKATNITFELIKE